MHLSFQDSSVQAVKLEAGDTAVGDTLPATELSHERRERSRVKGL